MWFLKASTKPCADRVGEMVLGVGLFCTFIERSRSTIFVGAIISSYYVQIFGHFKLTSKFFLCKPLLSS